MVDKGSCRVVFIHSFVLHYVKTKVKDTMVMILKNDDIKGLYNCNINIILMSENL